MRRTPTTSWSSCLPNSDAFVPAEARAADGLAHKPHPASVAAFKGKPDLHFLVRSRKRGPNHRPEKKTFPNCPISTLPVELRDERIVLAKGDQATSTTRWRSSEGPGPAPSKCEVNTSLTGDGDCPTVSANSIGFFPLRKALGSPAAPSAFSFFRESRRAAAIRAR